MISIRGGADTRKRKGVSHDTFRGAAHGLAKDWCAYYCHQDTKSYSMRKYGEEIVSVLALEWCRKLQFYYDLC